MDNFLVFLTHKQMYFVLGVLLFFGVTETLAGYFASSKRTKHDVLIETVNTFLLFAITKPLITLFAFYLCSLIFPSVKDVLDTWPIWLMTTPAILVDDFIQYWYHRSSHEHKWLWKWHSPRHAAEEMGFLVSYREAIWFYVFMPNIWVMGILTYFGLGIGVATAIVLKQIVVISSHSTLTWDTFFYKRPKLMPIMKVLERIFITPTFHHGHHAVSIIDDIGNPNGNFGNMFSFWDQLFGSAKFTHEFPIKYGLQTDLKDDWKAHIFYPLIASKKQNSEISRAYKFVKTTKL